MANFFTNITTMQTKAIINTKVGACSCCISCIKVISSFIKGITADSNRSIITFVGVAIAFDFRIKVRTNMEDSTIKVVIYFNLYFHRDLIDLIKVIISIIINFISAIKVDLVKS